MKALQKDVDDKEAERETLLYVGYIRHVCTTILFIPRMQIYEYILAFVCLALLLRQQLATLIGLDSMDVCKDEKRMNFTTLRDLHRDLHSS